MNFHRMSAAGMAILVTIAVVAIAGCGAAPVATPIKSQSATTRTHGRKTVAGQLVQLAPNTLTLSTSTGDISVHYSSTTRIELSTVIGLSSISSGLCVSATGQSAPDGSYTAYRVNVSPAGRCMSTATNHPATRAGAAAKTVVGTVITATPTTLDLKTQNGSTIVVNIPTTVTVTESSVASPSEFQVNQCILARLPYTAVASQPANQIIISYPTVTGTCPAFHKIRHRSSNSPAP